MSQTKSQLIDAIDGSIVTADIADDAVNADKLASNSVVSASIVDGSIVNADVNASAAIAGSKIADFVTGNTNNRVLTASGTANSFIGEANLTFDGATLNINGTSTDTPLILDTSNTAGSHLRFQKDSSNKHFLGCGGGFGLGDVDDLSLRTVDNIIFGVSTSEKMRIDSAGRVLIGTTTPVTTDSNNHAKLVAISSAGPNIQLGNNTTDIDDNTRLGTVNYCGNHGSTFRELASLRAAADEDHTSSSCGSRLEFYTTSSGATGPTERMRVDKDGAFMVGTTTARTAEFSHPDGISFRGDVLGQYQSTVTDDTNMLLNRDGTDGQMIGFRKDGTGIGEIGVSGSDLYLQFGSTGSATHRLDDYEEGQFTPIIQGTGSNNSKSYTTQLGEYTKIGHMVWVRFRVGWSSRTTDSGSAAIFGLPFNCNDAVAVGGSMAYKTITFGGTSSSKPRDQTLESMQSNNGLLILTSEDGENFANVAASIVWTSSGEVRGTAFYTTDS